MKGGTLTDAFIEQLMRETGKSISDADRNKIQRIVGMSDGSPSMRIRDQLVRSLQETGKSISDSDMRRIGAMSGFLRRQKPKRMDEGGKVKKPKTLPKPKPKIGDRNEMGPIYTDTKTGKKVKRLNKGGGLNAAIDRVKKTQGMEDGGEVPKKFKGFSKLPEDVQQQMNPTLAAKYEDGGAVRGMGRAYMGAPRKAKIR
tara:strand:+ start:876 stop:1472 length:597 start_codon:yes stop_codon:yes gene_type:complete